MITVNGLSKEYRVAKRKKGAGAALRALFSREYDVVRALREVSFAIRAGEIVGYIGPNGAGKSTTIKILSGILRPDGGTCEIAGRVPWRQRREHVRDLGVVFGQRTQLWWDVPVEDSYDLLRDIYAVPEAQYQKTLKTLCEALDVGPLLSTPLRQLSLGQRMRCELAGSLLHSPKMLFLDEPTIGLDAVSKLAVRSFLRGVQAEGNTTILLTTHDMADIEALTDRIMLIGHGRLLYDGALREIKAKYDERRVLTAEFRRREAPLILPFGELLSWEGERASWAVPSSEAAAAMALLSRELELTDLTSQGTSVEEIIAKLYKEYRL